MSHHQQNPVQWQPRLHIRLDLAYVPQYALDLMAVIPPSLQRRCCVFGLMRARHESGNLEDMPNCRRGWMDMKLGKKVSRNLHDEQLDEEKHHPMGWECDILDPMAAIAVLVGKQSEHVCSLGIFSPQQVSQKALGYHTDTPQSSGELKETSISTCIESEAAASLPTAGTSRGLKLHSSSSHPGLGQIPPRPILSLRRLALESGGWIWSTIGLSFRTFSLLAHHNRASLRDDRCIRSSKLSTVTFVQSEC
ncbi:hypothetical protein QBC35DRAFT_470319 [Podospora australis]|uniref:Uncharacterized protein n=1 Tax=Podospora australis TaxID=1536484 RepID=A0AAN6X2I2_9PEZI|nr:hypothetical protein QBC35DRAFT_470319 [Podospora australis]